MIPLKEVVRLWLQLDALEDLSSPEADKIRDESDIYWYQLSESDHKLLRELLEVIGK